MPDKTWETPPGQYDRDPQAESPEREPQRKLETRALESDADHDARDEPEEINFHGSER
jgi:hypothetical protein